MIFHTAAFYLEYNANIQYFSQRCKNHWQPLLIALAKHRQKSCRPHEAGTYLMKRKKALPIRWEAETATSQLLLRLCRPSCHSFGEVVTSLYVLSSPAVPSFKDSKNSCVESFAPVQTSGFSTSGALIKDVTFINNEKKISSCYKNVEL